MPKAKPHDGGPAFPGLQFTEGHGCAKIPGCREEHDPGMSLRAWLAGMAMQGLLASNRCSVDTLGVLAVVAADSVLGALEVSRADQ